MNKQEVLDKLKTFQTMCDTKEKHESGMKVGIEMAMELVEQIDESAKIVIPHYIAEWIEKCKEKNNVLNWAMGFRNEVLPKKVADWLFDASGGGKSETFARAWLDGYEAES